MPISTSDLIGYFRLDEDDPEMPGSGDDSDSLWSDAELTRYFAEAQNILCRKNDVLFDLSFDITTEAGTGLYALNQSITKVRRGVISGSRTLEALNMSELKRKFSVNDMGWDLGNWEDAEGDPQYIVTDYATGYVLLVPKPVQIEVIKLHAYRLPTNSAVMEVPDRWRMDLLLYAKYKAYDKNDSDTHNEKKALKYKGLWEQKLVELDHEEKRRNKSARVVAYGGL